jgi:hypothetical protein
MLRTHLSSTEEYTAEYYTKLRKKYDPVYKLKDALTTEENIKLWQKYHRLCAEKHWDPLDGVERVFQLVETCDTTHNQNLAKGYPNLNELLNLMEIAHEAKKFKPYKIQHLEIQVQTIRQVKRATGHPIETILTDERYNINPLLALCLSPNLRKRDNPYFLLHKETITEEIKNKRNLKQIWEYILGLKTEKEQESIGAEFKKLNQPLTKEEALQNEIELLTNFFQAANETENLDVKPNRKIIRYLDINYGGFNQTGLEKHQNNEKLIKLAKTHKEKTRKNFYNKNETVKN